MLRLAVLIFTLIFSSKAEWHNWKVGTVDGHGNCRSPAAALSALAEEKFAGVWYLDSSDSPYLARTTCNSYKFTWFKHEFTHDNWHYSGYFKYWYRVTQPHSDTSGTEYCYQCCSFSRQGYLHGFQTHGPQGQCIVDASNFTVAGGSDPCHPHYQDKWDFWVLKTDYKSYALTYLCANGNSNVMLFNRSKKNFSAAFRQQMQRYLTHNGIYVKLLVSHQTTC